MNATDIAPHEDFIFAFSLLVLTASVLCSVLLNGRK